MSENQISQGSINLQGRIKGSRWVVTGFLATTFAIMLSMAVTAALGVRFFDWISPPFAAVGLVCCVVAIVTGRRPRRLALGMLALNLAYWAFFLLILASRR